MMTVVSLFSFKALLKNRWCCLKRVMLSKLCKWTRQSFEIGFPLFAVNNKSTSLYLKFLLFSPLLEHRKYPQCFVLELRLTPAPAGNKATNVHLYALKIRRIAWTSLKYHLVQFHVKYICIYIERESLTWCSRDFSPVLQRVIPVYLFCLPPPHPPLFRFNPFYHTKVPINIVR